MTDPTKTKNTQGDYMHNGNIRDDLFDGTLNGYQAAAQTTAIYPGKGTALGLMYTALKGCGEAGEFAEHVGKAMRDDGYGQPTERIEAGRQWVDPAELSELSVARRELLVKEIGDELWYIAAKCTELGITLEYAAHLNILKLKDRQNRGTLSGSGDTR